jgi:hypothetical protein
MTSEPEGAKERKLMLSDVICVCEKLVLKCKKPVNLV